MDLYQKIKILSTNGYEHAQKKWSFDIEIIAFYGQLKYMQKAEETDTDVILTWKFLVNNSYFSTNEIKEYYNFIKKAQESYEHFAILKKN